MYDEHDKINGLVSIKLDYTERKKQIEQLTLFNQILENLSDPVHVLDVEGQLLFLNNAATEVFGIPFSDIDKYKAWQMSGCLPETEWFEFRDLLLNGGISQTQEVVIENSNRGQVFLEMTFLPMHLGDKHLIIVTSRNITARSLAQKALSESEERKASLIESMNDLVFVLDKDLRIIDYHNPFGQRLHVPPSVFMNKRYDEIGMPEHVTDVLRDTVMECLRTGQLAKAEYMLENDGQEYWSDLHTTLLKNQNGEVNGVTCVIRDISERVNAEKSLKNHLKLQEILLKISTVYINMGLDKVEDMINDSLREMAEFVSADRAYVFSYDFTNYTCSTTHEWVREGISAEMDNQQDIPLDYVPDWVQAHEKGEEYYVPDIFQMTDSGPYSLRGILEPQSIKSILTLPMLFNGKLYGFVGFDFCHEFHKYSEAEKNLLKVFAQMLMNVFERKSAEMMLTLQEQRYRNMISNINLGLIERDLNNNIVFVNQHFCDMIGYSYDELVGKDATIIMSTDETKEMFREKMKLRKLGISDTYQVMTHKKNGDELWWIVSGSPLFNDKNELKGATGVFFDFTKQKKLELELEKARITAETASKAKETFLANMSHEIRTPLNVITGMIRELSKENLNDRQMSYIRYSESAASHLLTIINDILDISKISEGELVLDNKEFNLKTAINDVKSMFVSRAEKKQLKFNVTVQEEICPNVIGDAVRLRQVLINLLANSIKFTESGYINLSVSLRAKDDKKQSLLFEVEDSGIGMSDEYMKKLFNKFSQEQDDATRPYEGTGLGISITKELVHLMGGDIKVISIKGEGTTFSFEVTMPYVDSAVYIKKEIGSYAKCFNGVNILLVEDNELNRFIACQSLKYTGALITEAENGLEAIMELKRKRFDIVIMDVQMPEMDGVAATQCIRNELKVKTPILAMTANMFKEDIDLYLSVGMNDYVIKPYDEIDLFDKIKRLLHNDTLYPEIDFDPVPLYNTKELESISRGDDQFVKKMLQIFMHQSSKAIIEFNHHLQCNQVDEIRKLAHKIKPGIDNLDITLLREKIRALEKWDGNRDVKDLKAQVKEVVDILQTVIEKMKEDLL